MTHTHSFSSSQISAISGIVRCVCVCVGKRATNTTTTKQTIYQMHRITTVHTIPFVFSCIVHKIYGFYLHAEEVDINWIQARHHSFEPSEMSMYRKKKTIIQLLPHLAASVLTHKDRISCIYDMHRFSFCYLIYTYLLYSCTPSSITRPFHMFYH